MKTFQFQDKKKTNYFEGWYTRLVDQEKGINYAFIFALTKNADDPHAFIQIYDGVKLTNTYLRFESSDFSYQDGVVRIGENILSLEKLYVVNGGFEVSVSFKEKVFLDKHLGFRSAMSFMSLFPLVCFQEVNINDGLFSGIYKDENETYRIKGKLYMEKTYGHRFPKEWVWIQSNHFDKDVSISVGLGLIPLFGKLRKGYFGIIRYQKKDYRFGIYNFSKVEVLEENGNRVLLFKKRKYSLRVEVEDKDPVTLVGPSEKAVMNLDVFESINATCKVRLTKGKEVLVESNGKYVGFENMYKKKS